VEAFLPASDVTLSGLGGQSQLTPGALASTAHVLSEMGVLNPTVTCQRQIGGL